MKSRTKVRLTGFGIILMLLFSNPAKTQTIKDISGNVYPAVKHGTQTWSGSNLVVSKFRNGEVIPEAKTPEEWKAAGEAGKPAWCYYDNDPANGTKYGKLYNWYAINDKRGLAPKGWHIATNVDWSMLIKNLTSLDIAGTKLKSKTGWKSNSGTDLIGFAAHPAGYRNKDGKFEAIGTIGQWWSNSVPVEVKKSNQIYSLVIKAFSPEAIYMQMSKGSGLSVRFIKD
jgi:uncharacterized protein (TIGR02145 family)